MDSLDYLLIIAEWGECGGLGCGGIPIPPAPGGTGAGPESEQLFEAYGFGCWNECAEWLELSNENARMEFCNDFLNAQSP